MEDSQSPPNLNKHINKLHSPGPATLHKFPSQDDRSKIEKAGCEVSAQTDDDRIWRNISCPGVLFHRTSTSSLCWWRGRGLSRLSYNIAFPRQRASFQQKPCMSQLWPSCPAQQWASQVGQQQLHIFAGNYLEKLSFAKRTFTAISSKALSSYTQKYQLMTGSQLQRAKHLKNGSHVHPGEAVLPAAPVLPHANKTCTDTAYTN